MTDICVECEGAGYYFGSGGNFVPCTYCKGTGKAKK